MKSLTASAKARSIPCRPKLIFQYSWAAKELGKFCNLTHVEFTTAVIDADAPTILV